VPGVSANPRARPKQALRAGVFPSSVLVLINVRLSATSHVIDRPAAVGLLFSGLCLLFLAGCVSSPRRPPGRTSVETGNAVLPAHLISNFFVVESKWDDGHTYRFIIDTGSTATLVTPDLAKRFELKSKKPAPAKVPVRSANGGQIELDPITLRKVSLGEASFERVPALVFDLTALSDHLGVRIDGVIGFPVFRNTLLTLDYPGEQLVIAPSPGYLPPPKPAPRTSVIPFNGEQNTPLIPVQMGTESFIVLIDTGSDGSLSLNPAGLHPRFLNGPRPGTLISSLQGDRRQLTGRLNQNVLVGTHVVEQPIVDLSDQLSSLGGEFLKNFTITFDQRRKQVTFVRHTDGPVTMGPRLSTGLAFSRAPVYWRVLTVIPETPTAGLAVQTGDLCVRINGEPVDRWTFDRYAELLRTAAKITYTFITGTKETDIEVPVFSLVP